jgi:riboflavin synthase
VPLHLSEKTVRTTKKGVSDNGTGAATVIKAAGCDAGMAIDKYLQEGEWGGTRTPKPEEAPAAK